MVGGLEGEGWRGYKEGQVFAKESRSSFDVVMRMLRRIYRHVRAFVSKIRDRQQPAMAREP